MSTATPRKPAPHSSPARKTRAYRAKKPSAIPAAPKPVAPPLTPEQMPAQPPRVTYSNGQLTIDSQNSTLADILTAVRAQTGAQIDPPPNAGERVAAHLSGPPREVLSSLLDGANVGYIIVGSPDNQNVVQKVLLTTLRSGPSPPASAAMNTPPPPEPDDEPPPPQPMVTPQPGMQPGMHGQPNSFVGGQQSRFGAPGTPQQVAPQPGQAQVPGQPPVPGQPQVKTPQQLLQELQQLRNRINVNPNRSLNDNEQ